MSKMVTCFSGNANTWECDEMGHMNVRFYVSKGLEGLATFSHLLGIGPSWQNDQSVSLGVIHEHIRYIREVMPGEDLSIEVGILSASPEQLEIFQLMHNTRSGQIACSMIHRVELRRLSDEVRVPFNESILEKTKDYLCTIPEKTGPRSLFMDAPFVRGSKTDAENWGMRLVSMGQVTPQMVDRHGVLPPDGYIGRISDGIGNFMGGLRKNADVKSPVQNIGGAALEYRLNFLEPLKVGDIVGVYVGLKAVTDRFFIVTHWTVNLQTGRLVTHSEALAVSLDLDARKMIPIAAENKENLEKAIVAELSPD